MIRDLLHETGPVLRETDVHIVGGGTVGTMLACRLAQSGLRVVVTESGGEQQLEPSHPLNEVEQTGAPYNGASLGRFRCLGGTSTRWGGAMIPPRESDLTDSVVPWPIAWQELMAYQADVEALFQLPRSGYDAAPGKETASDFLPRLAKWPPFSRRNVAALFKMQITSADGPEIWLNATATEFPIAERGLKHVVARAPNGNTITVGARHTVLAAGAIECTRLLLLMDHQNGNRLFAGSVLGRYFYDHLSVEMGEVSTPRNSRLNRFAGFRFEDGGMRNLRFEPHLATQGRRVTAGFAHIAFEDSSGGGFDALRAIYRALQEGSAPSPRRVAALAADLPWLAQAIWWRYVNKRLLYPKDARISVHIVTEQVPRPENRITLSANRTDAYGQPLAAIEWSVSDEDKENSVRFAREFASYWSSGDLGQLATLRSRPSSEMAAALGNSGGVYHPGGSTRMGRSLHDGVVDGNLQVFAVPNLSVIATSVFPSGGSVNPTMTLLMAGLRLADKLKQREYPSHG